MIIEGRRNLSDDMIAKFAKAFDPQLILLSNGNANPSILRIVLYLFDGVVFDFFELQNAFFIGTAIKNFIALKQNQMTLDEFTFNGVSLAILFNELKVQRVFVKANRTLEKPTHQTFAEFICPHSIYPIHAKHDANFGY